MGEILFDLQQQLRSKPENLTPQEVSVLRKFKANCTKEVTVGAAVGSGLAWIATRRLGRFVRINLSIGAAGIVAIWRFRSSLDSCLDQLLALDGSRMQKELATIIVQKFPDNPRRMQLISKHFYSERVFDDSTSDQPRLRWRYRNFCADNAAYSQQTQDSDNHSDSDNKETDLEPKQVPMNSGTTLMEDPFDCIFGYSATGEEICHPDTSSVRPRVLNRSNKRSHHRRRLHHQHASETLNT